MRAKSGSIYARDGSHASGKSTAAQMLRKDLKNKNISCSIHSTDDYFIDKTGNYSFSSYRLTELHQSNLTAATTSTAQVVIVDNTNLISEFRAKYSCTKRYLIHLATKVHPVDELYLRNKHGVPRDQIERMSKSYNPLNVRPFQRGYFALENVPRLSRGPAVWFQYEFHSTAYTDADTFVEEELHTFGSFHKMLVTTTFKHSRTIVRGANGVPETTRLSKEPLQGFETKGGCFYCEQKPESKDVFILCTRRRGFRGFEWKKHQPLADVLKLDVPFEILLCKLPIFDY